MNIFESPDGGKTIYQRESPYTAERKLVKEDFSIISRIKERQLLDDIRQAAMTNNTLHEAMERVKVIYYLSKDNGNSKT
jgi:hypothetical protein